MMSRLSQVLCLVFLLCSGCSKVPKFKDEIHKTNLPKSLPVFTLAFSEYPSWACFGVAHEKGLIDQRAGHQGPIENDWNVDIVLKLADYDTCITLYSTNAVDAACLTNLDSLPPSFGRPGVVVLPTSTSVGGDVCIVTSNVTNLKNVTTRGLEKSVSQYVFERNLELKNLDAKDFKFQNMDPAAAAQALQTNQPEIQSIMVWQPFALQTLRTRTGTRIEFDSTTIPEEIVDGVTIGKDVLSKTGGKDFACAVIATYYAVNRQLEDPKTKDDTLVAIGAKFSNLGLEDMKIVTQLVRFYKTPQEALTLLNSSKFQGETMPRLVKFCKTHEMLQEDHGLKVFGFNDENVLLNFSTEFLERVLVEGKSLSEI